MEYTFIAFVSTFNVQYPQESDDPIFSAQNETTCTNVDGTCYINLLQRASPFACTEFAQVCTADAKSCYDVWDPTSFEKLSTATWDGAEEALLVLFSLQYSDFGTLLNTKHGLLLDATNRIIGNKISEALSNNPPQWQLEVDRLFSMALIRTKFEMLSAVLGTKANAPGYSDILPSDKRGLCSKFKFEAQGYKNLYFVGIMLAVLIPLFLGIELTKEPPVVWLAIGVQKLARFGRRYVVVLFNHTRVSVVLQALRLIFRLPDGVRFRATAGGIVIEMGFQ
jgi:hypothetical protein